MKKNPTWKRMRCVFFLQISKLGKSFTPKIKNIGFQTAGQGEPAPMSIPSPFWARPLEGQTGPRPEKVGFEFGDPDEVQGVGCLQYFGII
jgi:hypothetical protein